MIKYSLHNFRRPKVEVLLSNLLKSLKGRAHVRGYIMIIIISFKLAKINSQLTEVYKVYRCIPLIMFKCRKM